MKRVNFRPIRRALCLLLCLGVLLAAAPPARAGTAGSLSLSTGSVSQGGSVTLRLRAEQLTGLIDALGGAFGLIFGMTGACGLLLLISISSALGVVTG